MHYTQQDGRKYHYISDPSFEELFAVAEEWEYAKKKPDWVENKAKGAIRRMEFDSGDDVAFGDWEMRATLYDWSSSSYVLETREVLHRKNGEEFGERKWYVIPEWKYSEIKGEIE